MTEAEFQVLDELYFISSYQDLKGNVELDDKSIKEALKHLLEQKYIFQMKYEHGAADYIKCLEHDLENMEKYNYLASKEGLLAHNT